MAFFVGDFLTGFVGDALAGAGASSGISFAATGDPSPVHASQPGPAEYVPLFPWVMS